MCDRLRARVAVHRPDACRLAELSEKTDVISHGSEVELFASSERVSADDTAELFNKGEKTVYRSEWDGECLCRAVESLGHPVADVKIEDGVLRLTLYLQGTDELRTVLEVLRGLSETVKLERLRHGDGEADEEHPRYVDVERLTDRQREVLLAAYREGYFETPRETKIEALAERLNVAPSTVHEHLTAAQRTVFAELFDGR